jgi:hypothetical protein
MKNIALVVAGFIFSLVTLIHVLRLIYAWDITIGTKVIPLSVSVIGLIVAASLAIWMFTAAILD